MIHINKHILMKMLELSSSAYQESLPSCQNRFFEIIEDKATDTECFFQKSGKDILVVFRGTDSKTNWANNFLFCKKTIPYGNSNTEIRVHSGFLKSYKSVRHKLQDRIPHDSCRIRITGHSLGAALAVLCGVDMQYNFPNADIEVYLFGCPCVGNAAFAKSYNRRVFKTLRITNGNDIVTKLPPKIFGYRHVGISIHTGKLSIPAFISFDDHRPENYYKSLWQSL